MIVVHGETLWSPAPQPMNDDDDDNERNNTIFLYCFQDFIIISNACLELKTVIFRANPGMGGHFR